LSIRRDEIPWEAAFLAGRRFLEYRGRVKKRKMPFRDFLIGAHAAVRGMVLMTRDAGQYRAYFPKLRLIAPGKGAASNRSR
jgi:predicted nucleic acid-binding protein